MSIGVLVILVFVAVTAAIVGLFMLISGRTQVRREQAIQNRLQEVSGGPAATDEDAAGGSTLLVKESVGPLPNMERAASAAIKGSGLESWLQQTGTTMTISVRHSVHAGVRCARRRLQLTCSRISGGRGMVAFVLGLGIQPFILKQKRSARIYRFEEHFPEALDLLSRAVRAGHAFSAGMKMVADELDDPVGPEFRKAFDEQNYGLPLKESLNGMADAYSVARRQVLRDGRFDPARDRRQPR